jgi:type VI secretion system secreted protein VgrG
VVGPSGEEIYTDEYGRIKVQFHWDRYGKNDEKSSCWIRVAQDICGRNWGHIVLPRIGQEVVVAFLEGDPDQPLVIGSVYNGDLKPPYDLPANKTQLGLKTRSSKGGGTGDFNELRFEDKAGEEQIYFHAQRDFERVVERDDTLDVQRHQTITVKNNRTETVKEGNESVTVSQGNRSVTVSQGNDSLDVSAGDHSRNVGKNISEEAGMGIKIKAGTSITIEAGISIELKVGGNKITIDNAGITVKGIMVTADGSASTTVKSGGLVTVQGPLVKIN